MFLTGTKWSGAKGSGAHWPGGPGGPGNGFGGPGGGFIQKWWEASIVIIIKNTTPRTTKTITRTTRTTLASVHQTNLVCLLEKY